MSDDTLILDSRARITTLQGSTNETPIWDMTSTYKNHLKDIRSFEIKSVTIPNVWFQITNSNNQANIVNNSTNAWVLTMTNGSYASGTAFATQLQTDLNTQDPDGEGYTVTYSSINQTFTIVNGTGAYSILWNTGANASTSLRAGENVIGFSDVDQTAAATYTSDLGARVQGEDYLILRSRALRPALRSNIYYDQFVDDTLCYIPVLENKGSVINYIPEKPLIFQADQLSISKLDLTLTNRYSTLSLRGAPWLITLSLCK